MSAIADSRDKSDGPLNVLFALHPAFDTLDFCGPFEMLSHALHDIKDQSTKAFKFTIAGPAQSVKSAQGATFKADISYEDAIDDMSNWDMVVIPGGGIDALLKDNSPEPINLIQRFAKLQEEDPSKERTLFSVCTGSLLLAQAGLLQGLAATTHPDYYLKLELLCQEAARKGDLERTDVMEERYVVNNARFDLGEKWEENPFILDKRPDTLRRKSNARKGSESYRLSKRRESIVKRSNLRLGGLRVITSGGVTTGMDAALYLVAALVSVESAQEVARITQYQWQKGVTVEGIDV